MTMECLAGRFSCMDHRRPGQRVPWLLASTMLALLLPSAVASSSRMSSPEQNRDAAKAAEATPSATLAELLAASEAASAAPVAAPGIMPGRLSGYAVECTPPTLQSWPVTSPRVPPLPSGEKPNFIIVLVDDMGYDDLGVHHPRGADGKSSAGASTPNIDRLIKSGMSFRNFYTASLCAATRAQLLTGRDFVRTGNLFNTRGFDTFNLGEATAGDVMQQAGYITAHYGKWHNGYSLGYEPWMRGFNESWLPSPYVHVDNLMRHAVNGVSEYVQTSGLMEQVLMDRLLGFVTQRAEDKKPFFIYYAPYSMHGMENADETRMAAAGSRAKRPSFEPEPYMSYFRSLKPTVDLSTAKAWALAAYIDDVFGRLLNFIENSQLQQNTYIMLTGDNGPFLSRLVLNSQHRRLRRMPSGMLGSKNKLEASLGSRGAEGAIRNHLAVAGPGVPSGAKDDTLLTVSDILPTVAALSGAADKMKHMPWSGVSFANLLVPDESTSGHVTGSFTGKSTGNATGKATMTAAGYATELQQERFIFTLTFCPLFLNMVAKQLPELGPDREVLKTQPRLQYVSSDGSNMVKDCLVGRYKDYKWFGNSDRVFSATLNGTPVSGETEAKLAAMFDSAARKWWEEVLAEPHSFEKPIYQLGLAGDNVTNIESAGAAETNMGSRVIISKSVISNMTEPGDRVCWKINIITPGLYTVVVMYKSSFPAVMCKLSLGVYSAIVAGTADSITAVFPQVVPISTLLMGTFQLAASDGQPTEACFELSDISPRLLTKDKTLKHFALLDSNDTASNGTTSNTTTNSTRSFFALSNLRFTLLSDHKRSAAAVAASDPGVTPLPPLGMPIQAVTMSVPSEPTKYRYLQPTAAMQQVERQARAAAAAAAARSRSSSSSSSSGSDTGRQRSSLQVWQHLSRQYKWPSGQILFESMYSPWDHEGPDTQFDTPPV